MDCFEHAKKQLLPLLRMIRTHATNQATKKLSQNFCPWPRDRVDVMSTIAFSVRQSLYDRSDIGGVFDAVTQHFKI